MPHRHTSRAIFIECFYMFLLFSSILHSILSAPPNSKSRCATTCRWHSRQSASAHIMADFGPRNVASSPVFARQCKAALPSSVSSSPRIPPSTSSHCVKMLYIKTSNHIKTAISHPHARTSMQQSDHGYEE